MPHVKELYDRYKDKGLEVIGVASDDGNAAAGKKQWLKTAPAFGTMSWRDGIWRRSQK